MWFAFSFACTEYDFAQSVDVEVPTCAQEGAPDGTVPLHPECAGEPEIGTFTPVVEWKWTTNATHPGYEQVMSTPAVANLTDDDGDGDIDDSDVPDVVFTAFAGGAYTSPGALVAISGADGRQLWSVIDANGHQPYSSSGVLVADLDGDGVPSVVVSAVDGLLAVRADGTFEWSAAIPTSTYGSPAAADVDGDSISEVIYGASIVDAHGAPRFTGALGNGGGAYGAFLSFGADLDGDGEQELVTGRTAYRADGTVLWDDGGADGLPAMADLDLDGDPEVIRVAGGHVLANDGLTGALVWNVALADGTGGPPTVADFDGDGAPEIGVAGASFYQVFESDGSERWRAPVSDFSSNVTGSSVFDFEGDGAAEVVYADEHTLWVYDGATGAVEMQYDEHSSGTLFEYPLIVDVDHDGSTEIVLASNDYAYSGSHGITAIGDAADSWAPARPVWNQGAYAITNVNDDGTVPADPEQSWTSWNSFRAGNSQSPSGLAQADLGVGRPDACTIACTDDTIDLWVPVTNDGSNRAFAFDVTVRAIHGTDRVEIGRIAVDGLDAGAVTSVGPFPVARDAFGDGLVIEVDAADVVRECDESDNTIRLDVFPCDAG